MQFDVIFPSQHGQSDIPYFTMASFQTDEYHWNTNFLNDTKLNLKAFNDNNF